MLAHEALEQYRSDHPSFDINTASFCAGHDYVLHSEQVQGLVKALEQLVGAINEGVVYNKQCAQAIDAINKFKGA